MAHLLSRLIQSYKRHGYKIRGGLNPYYFDNPDAPFMTLYRDGEPKSTGAGLAPIEILILEQILSSLPEARRILIIGNAFGWSTLAIAMSCPAARVIAIDADIEGTDSGLGRKLTEDIAREEKLDVRVVNALSPRDVASVVRDQLDDGPLDFVLIDGLHVNEQLRRDLAAVSPHMSDNGIIVLHDTLSWHMLSAVSEFSESHGYKFQILTRSPSGMAVAYREAQPLTMDIIDSYVDETLDLLEWLASKGGNIAEPGPELLPRLSKGYSTRLFGLAEVYVAEGDWAKVAETLTRLVRENPSNADTAFNAGAFLFDRGRPLDSEVFFVQAQTLAPNWHLPPHQLGRVSRQLGRWEEALEHFSHAVRLNPAWVHSHIEMGAIEIARGNTAKALQYFISAAILDEGNLSIRTELMRLHLALGQFFDALDDLITYQTLLPTAILPWEDLAASLPGGDAGQKAVLALERLCQQRSDWRGARKALGIVLRKTGRLTDSRNVFENSADHFPGWLGAGVLYELALTCEELGDHDHAKRYLEQALKLRPSFEPASQALSRLVEGM
ncbi:MAG: tetratricopeptide repeat protein [Pseudomonadota bacterium]